MIRCKIIGLTGQSGAGKSTVLRCWQDKGACIFDSDLAVRRIYETNSACLNAVAARFGADIIDGGGQLIRPLLAQRAFSSAENTQALNELVHPFVTAEMLKLIKREQPEYIVCDAPQLFESNIDVLCDVIVSVTADEAARIKRICLRDGISPEQARLRISAQLDERFFREHSDIVIENDRDEADLIKKAEKVYDLIVSIKPKG